MLTGTPAGATSQAIVEAILTHTDDLVLLFDERGTVTWVSPSCRRLFGVAPERLVGRNGFEMIHPDDRERVVAGLLSVQAVGDQARAEFRVVDTEGRVRWVDEVATRLVAEDGAAVVVGHLRDITEQVGRRRLAEADRQRLADAQATAHLGSFEIDVATGEVVLSDELWRILGRPPGSFSGMDHGVIHPGDRDEVVAALDAALAGATGLSRTHRVVRPGGEVRWVVSRTSHVHTEGSTVVAGTVLDVTERHEAQLALAHQATHDPLTGLANRHRFVAALEAALAGGGPVAVLYVDLDEFKEVNDRVGHVDGDEVLRHVGRQVAGAVAGTGTVARMGGDELVVCCPGLADAAGALAVAERIQRAVQVPVAVAGEQVVIRASVGIALSGDGGHAEVLLRRADVAMYAAKEAGGGRAEVFDDALHVQQRERAERARDLRRALAAGEVTTWFQPEVALDDGHLVGFEALARWEHPERGPVPPDEFVPLAEECGAVHELGALVLADACRALAGWRADGARLDLGVSVNVSAVQLADPGFPDAVAAALAAAGVPPGQLCLEVTESALMDPDAASAALQRLRDVGVVVAIDDFGTGYSSLSRLKRFAVDFLKVDRSFVAGLGTDADDDAIVAWVVHLAGALRRRVIAEGIETEAQRDALAALGCAYGQGFLWSRAVPAARARELATEWRPEVPPGR